MRAPRPRLPPGNDPDTPKGTLKTQGCPYVIGSGSANERFTWSVKSFHETVVKTSVPPSRLVVSRTRRT